MKENIVKTRENKEKNNENPTLPYLLGPWWYRGVVTSGCGGDRTLR
jgi:hypothetical protein